MVMDFFDIILAIIVGMPILIMSIICIIGFPWISMVYLYMILKEWWVDEGWEGWEYIQVFIIKLIGTPLMIVGLIGFCILLINETLFIIDFYLSHFINIETQFHFMHSVFWS